MSYKNQDSILGSMNASAGYEGDQRQRNMTIGDLLLDNRIVFLQGEITSGSANELIMKLLFQMH